MKPGIREESKEAEHPSGLRLKRGLGLVERKGHGDICRRNIQKPPASSLCPPLWLKEMEKRESLGAYLNW